TPILDEVAAAGWGRSSSGPEPSSSHRLRRAGRLPLRARPLRRGGAGPPGHAIYRGLRARLPVVTSNSPAGSRLHRGLRASTDRPPLEPRGRMRQELSLIAVGLVPLLVGGCAEIHRLGDYAIVEDGSPEPASAITPNAPPATEPAGDEERGCQTNRDCTVLAATSSTSAQIAPAVCVKATGKCERLLTPSCPRFVGDPSDEHAIVIGALLSRAGEESAASSALE